MTDDSPAAPVPDVPDRRLDTDPEPAPPAPGEVPLTDDGAAPGPTSADVRRRRPEYKGEELDPERGPGLGCFWFQMIVLGFFIVLIPIGLNLGWPFEVLALLLFVVIGLLLLTGQTVIFLLRLVAADRRAQGRRRPLASPTKTVGELEDDHRVAHAVGGAPRPAVEAPQPGAAMAEAAEPRAEPAGPEPAEPGPAEAAQTEAEPAELEPAAVAEAEPAEPEPAAVAEAEPAEPEPVAEPEAAETESEPVAEPEAPVPPADAEAETGAQPSEPAEPAGGPPDDAPSVPAAESADTPEEPDPGVRQ